MLDRGVWSPGESCFLEVHCVGEPGEGAVLSSLFAVHGDEDGSLGKGILLSKAFSLSRHSLLILCGPASSLDDGSFWNNG